MRTLALLAFFGLSISICSSQVKTVEIEVESKFKPSVKFAQYIKGKGTLVLVEEEVSTMNQVSDPHIILLNDDLEAAWSIPVENRKLMDGSPYLLSSPNSEAAYFFSFNNNGKKLQIKKITWAGDQSDFVIEGFDKKISISNFNTNPEVLFVDKDKLFILQRYKIKNSQPAIEEGTRVTYFCMVDLKTHEVKDRIMDLPQEPNKYGYRYMGHEEGRIYFKAMDSPKNDDKVPTAFAIADFSGKLISGKQFVFDLSPKYTYISMNFQAYNEAQMNYTDYVQQQYSSDPQIYDFGYMHLSTDKMHVYLYGMSRDEEGIAKKRTGFFVAKYTLKGEKIWQNVYPLGSAAADKRIVLHASRSSLNGYFDINDKDGTVNYHFWEDGKVYNAIISESDGKLTDFFITNDIPAIYNSWFHNSVPYLLMTVDKKKYDQNAYNHIKTDQYGFYFRNDKGFIGVQRDVKGKKVKATFIPVGK